MICHDNIFDILIFSIKEKFFKWLLLMMQFDRNESNDKLLTNTLQIHRYLYLLNSAKKNKTCVHVWSICVMISRQPRTLQKKIYILLDFKKDTEDSVLYQACHFTLPWSVCAMICSLLVTQVWCTIIIIEPMSLALDWWSQKIHQTCETESTIKYQIIWNLACPSAKGYVKFQDDTPTLK